MNTFISAGDTTTAGRTFSGFINTENSAPAYFVLTDDALNYYLRSLGSKRKSPNTIEKYTRDLNAFAAFLGDDRKITNERLYKYRTYLEKDYRYGKDGLKALAFTSINSKLTAINSLLTFFQRRDLIVELFTLQKKSFLEKELTIDEVNSLITTAIKTGRHRLASIIFTLTSTGIRISELSAFTVEALERSEVQVDNKGKIRQVLLPSRLCKELKDYCKHRGIRSGRIFATRNGKALDRTNIWKELKQLAALAGVSEEKVFPHNFRHFFARNYYTIEGDIAGLSNLLGHSSINTTMIYVKESRAAAMKKIEHAGTALQCPSFYIRS